MSNEEFQQLIARLNAGDESAAEHLVRRYESFIRREVRFRLRDQRLNRLFDSMDICQSVLKSFFVRAACGMYDIAGPQELVNLLTTMTRRKLASTARAHYRQRRDVRRGSQQPFVVNEFVDPHPTPGQDASHRELVARVCESLSAEEREMAELRRAGIPWLEIANQIGGTPQGRRMQLARAIERVTDELGLDDE